MKKQELVKLKLPDEPGVYRFIGVRGETLYIGKATSLRDRVRSYFANDLLHTRGKHIVDMVTLAKTVRFTVADSVLDAIILEASLIKKYQPTYNTKEKDNKSWNYVVVTKEDFPRVLTIRERTMFLGNKECETYQHAFGPFPQETNLKEALNIIRRIFPFRDTCTPYQSELPQVDEIRGAGKARREAYDYTVTESQGHRNNEVRHLRKFNKPCFNQQIGLCPGVCIEEISKEEYAERIREIILFFSGKKTMLLKRLEQSMRAHAKQMEFEEAGEYKRMIFALRHIKDASLVSEEVRTYSQKVAGTRSKPFRIEAYDVAHISGKYTVGVMTVVEDGRPKKSDYRKFKVRIDPDRSNDVLHLEEVLTRRFGHKEWTMPDLVVVDGGEAQKQRGEKVLKELNILVPVVGVVKDVRHKPKAILGNKELALSYKRAILTANGEAHRFAVEYHRLLRGRLR